ncbi:MAG: HU family DNA-binding protein [Alphaproteobacteria bacterium]|nr:HU family DNA-binding protein [Alphaproteobacteria bacterium]
MSWADTIKRVAEASGLSQADTRKVLAAFVDVVTDTVVDGERIAVPQLGTFESRYRQGRSVRHVRNGMTFVLDARHVPRFQPAAAFRRALAARTPQLLSEPGHQEALRLAEALVGDIDLYHGTQAPRIGAQATEEDVDATCAAVLGGVWTAARATYARRVPAEVTARRDWLATVAQRRWGNA